MSEQARRQPALHDPGEWLSNRLPGLFCAVSLWSARRIPDSGRSPSLNTGANSHYNGLQLTAEKRLKHGLQVQANYTWSHCLDTVSNGGFLQFSAGGMSVAAARRSCADRGPCDYDVRAQRHRKLHISVAVQDAQSDLESAFNGWQVSGSVFWHSGIPFSVLSAPYSAGWQWNRQPGRCRLAQFASVVPGVSAYQHECGGGRDPTRYETVAES